LTANRLPTAVRRENDLWAEGARFPFSARGPISIGNRPAKPESGEAKYPDPGQDLVVVTPPASKKLGREISGMAHRPALAGKPQRAPSSSKHSVASEIPCSEVQKSLLVAVSH
jgi:hypothetical protein